MEAGEPGSRRGREAIEGASASSGGKLDREACWSSIVRLDGGLVLARVRTEEEETGRMRPGYKAAAAVGAEGSGVGRGPYRRDPHLASAWIAERGGRGRRRCGEVEVVVGLREPGGVPCVACRFYNRRGRRTGGGEERSGPSAPGSKTVVNSNWTEMSGFPVFRVMGQASSNYRNGTVLFKGTKTDVAWLTVLLFGHSFIHA